MRAQPQLTEKGISIYSGELTLQVVIAQNIEIKKAFPELPNDWYDVFQKRIIENQFTNQRLIDAVNYVIDNCQYPRPTIAQFISFDKKIELKNGHEMMRLVSEDRNVYDKYSLVKFPGMDEVMFAKNTDIKKWKLKLFNTEDK